MKLHKLTCPNCDGMLKVEVKNQDQIYCPYCGQQFLVDSEKKEYTVNVNKHIRVDKNMHYRYTDDAEVIKAQLKDREDKRALLVLLVMFVGGILSLFLSIVIPDAIADHKEAQALREGKISAGYYGDLIGEDYKTVEAHFESAGFTNIELIDLDDSGLKFWTDGDVTVISIGGETNFSSSDYFDPATKVVISHH